MNENCLMGKEYIELRSSLDALCRSFIENKETIRDTFSVGQRLSLSRLRGCFYR